MLEQIKTSFMEAVERVVNAVARLLPGLVVMLVLVVISALLAVLASALARRLCVRLDVDRRLREWGMAAPAQEGVAGPSQLAARLVAWTVVGLGFLVGLSVLESSTTSALALRLLEYLPRAWFGMLILLAGVAGSRALERSVLIGAVNMGIHSARLLGLGARWLLLTLTTAMAFEHFGIGGTILTSAFTILFGGIVLSLSLAVGLGSRDLVARSLERRFQEQPEKREGPAPEPLHHL